MQRDTLRCRNQYSVVTVSFDPREPRIGRCQKTGIVGISRLGGAAGWHFLMGEEPSIRRLTMLLGFHYNYDPHAGQYPTRRAWSS